MGQQTNKYHISDDGKIYLINDDGSFTTVGNIKDIYEVKQLREKLAKLNRQIHINAVKHQPSYKKDYNVNSKSIAKIVLTCIFISIFLILCIMAIISS